MPTHFFLNLISKPYRLLAAANTPFPEFDFVSSFSAEKMVRITFLVAAALAILAGVRSGDDRPCWPVFVSTRSSVCPTWTTSGCNPEWTPGCPPSGSTPNRDARCLSYTCKGTGTPTSPAPTAVTTQPCTDTKGCEGPNDNAGPDREEVNAAWAMVAILLLLVVFLATILWRKQEADNLVSSWQLWLQ